MEQNDTQLDPSIVALAKAIGQSESGGKYDAKGKSGEFGAYQFTKPTWSTWATKHLGDPNAPMTPENQDKVAYSQIKEWGSQGYNPAQIASLWNSGKPDWEGNVGVNKFGVKYDTPAYVKSVQKAYETINSGGTATIDKTNPSSINTQYQGTQQPEQKTLGQELSDRATQFSDALSKPDINILSRGLQGAGAAAGALGDVVNKGLDVVSMGWFSKLTNLIGKGVGALANTDVGKSVVGSMQDFAKKHPELADDIGAGINIATAVPILKGIGLAKNAVMDGASIALKNVAEKGALKDLTEVVSRTATGRRLLESNPEVIKTMVDERILPELNGARYATKESIGSASERIKSLNSDVKKILNEPRFNAVGENQEQIVNNALNGYTDRAGNVVEGFKNSRFTPQDILDTGRELTPQNGLLWDKFEAGQANMTEINKLRSDLDQAVKSVYASTGQPPIKKEIGSTLAGAMRDYVQSNVPETQALFSQMTNLFKAQKALQLMDNKPIKTGVVGGLIKNVSTGVGEAGGNAIGIPVAGAFVGRGIGGTVERTLGRVAPRAIRTGILERTAPGVARQTLKGMAKKEAGLVGATMLNRASRP